MKESQVTSDGRRLRNLLGYLFFAAMLVMLVSFPVVLLTWSVFATRVAAVATAALYLLFTLWTRTSRARRRAEGKQLDIRNAALKSLTALSLCIALTLAFGGNSLSGDTVWWLVMIFAAVCFAALALLLPAVCRLRRKERRPQRTGVKPS